MRLCPPAERADYEPVVATVRADLAQPAFEAAWAAGQAMSPEEAVAYALEDAPSRLIGLTSRRNR